MARDIAEGLLGEAAAGQVRDLGRPLQHGLQLLRLQLLPQAPCDLHRALRCSDPLRF